MPKYVYSAKKIDGEKIKGCIEAKNKGAAISQLRKQENFCDIAVYLEGEMLESHRIEIINCPACQGKVSSQAGACPHCGQPIRPQAIPVLQSFTHKQKTISCPQCKNTFSAETKWCPECGRRLSAPMPWYIWVLFIGLALKLIGELMKKGVI